MEKIGELLKEQIAAGKLPATDPALQPERDMRKRVLTVTIMGPDASEIATGLFSAWKKVAADIMDRRKGVAVSVKLQELSQAASSK